MLNVVSQNGSRYLLYLGSNLQGMIQHKLLVCCKLQGKVVVPERALCIRVCAVCAWRTAGAFPKFVYVRYVRRMHEGGDGVA